VVSAAALTLLVQVVFGRLFHVNLPQGVLY
jgi:hypothetical protein